MEIRQVDKQEREYINTLISQDLRQLYSLISDYLPEYDGIMFSPEESQNVGKKKLDSIRPLLVQQLCVEWKLCDKINEPAFEDRVNLVVAIGDVLSSLTLGIPPFLIATILIKIGLRKLCNCDSK